jgi:hypothetical protein
MRVRGDYRAIMATTGTVWMLLALLLTTLAQAKPCLTKNEARQLYKTDLIYWHTAGLTAAASGKFAPAAATFGSFPDLEPEA